MKKISLSLFASVLFPSILYAQSPTNALQREYQNSLEEASLSAFSLNSIYKIPETTYHYLNNVFNNFSQKMQFTTSIVDSTFDDNQHYELISVPLISSNIDLIQLEIFGKLSNPNSAYLSNLSRDHALYEYFSHSETLDIYNSDIALGAGISFQTSPLTKIKILISNESLPGHGDSNALIGFDSKF